MQTPSDELLVATFQRTFAEVTGRSSAPRAESHFTDASILQPPTAVPTRCSARRPEPYASDKRAGRDQRPLDCFTGSRRFATGALVTRADCCAVLHWGVHRAFRSMDVQFIEGWFGLPRSDGGADHREVHRGSRSHRRLDCEHHLPGHAIDPSRPGLRIGGSPVSWATNSFGLSSFSLSEKSWGLHLPARTSRSMNVRSERAEMTSALWDPIETAAALT